MDCQSIHWEKNASGLVHEFRSEEFLPHDVLILLSDGAWEHMNNTILKSAAQNTGGSQASLSTAAEVLLDAVMKRVERVI